MECKGGSEDIFFNVLKKEKTPSLFFILTAVRSFLSLSLYFGLMAHATLARDIYTLKYHACLVFLFR